MPLPPSPLRLPPEGRRRPGRQIGAAAILGVLLAVSLGCTSAAPPPPVREPVQRAPVPLALEPADRPYLIDPFEGYSGRMDDAKALESAWRNLVDAGDTAGAARAAAEMLAASPDFLPAQVLAAQVD